MISLVASDNYIHLVRILQKEIKSRGTFVKHFFMNILDMQVRFKCHAYTVAADKRNLSIEKEKGVCVWY